MKRLFFLLFSTGLTVSLKATLPDITMILERAKKFESCQLYPLAREQYKYLLTIDRQNNAAKKSLDQLMIKETQGYLMQAQSAFDRNNLDLAHQAILSAIEINPINPDVLSLKARIEESMKIKNNISSRVNQEYQAGVVDYDKKNWNKSLEHFVRVLNMDPTHEGSLTYIEKIGEELKMKPESLR